MYLWGMLKDQVFYNNNPCIEDGLKESIQNAVVCYVYDGMIFNWIRTLACSK
jgi:hypothetical protein